MFAGKFGPPYITARWKADMQATNSRILVALLSSRPLAFQFIFLQEVELVNERANFSRSFIFDVFFSSTVSATLRLSSVSQKTSVQSVIRRRIPNFEWTKGWSRRSECTHVGGIRSTLGAHSGSLLLPYYRTSCKVSAKVGLAGSMHRRWLWK